MVVWDRRNYIHVEEVRFYEQRKKARKGRRRVLCCVTVSDCQGP